MKLDRLNPPNKGNARLLYITELGYTCDICDSTPVHVACFETIGTTKWTIDICLDCLKETIRRMEL